MSAPKQFRPGALWSLWDMLRVYAEHYLSLGAEFADFEVGLFYVPEIEGEAPSFPVLTDKQRADLKDFFQRASEHCRELGLKTAANAFADAVTDPPQTQREFRLVQKVFEQDLRRQTWLALSGSRARLYEKYERDDLLAGSAKAAFPTANTELRAAAVAYAAELDTACVFHCMRALEPVLRAMAADVKVIIGVDAWQVVINNIEAAIKQEAKTLPRGVPRNDRLQFLSEAAKEFGYFKDAWRNHCDHGRGTYDRQAAHAVMEHVRTFIEVLSCQLGE
jgi:hypothetical protein